MKEIEGFVNDAEKERDDLEAKETGRRQAEMIIKKREQKLYQEILEVNRGLADEVLDETIDFSSEFLTKQLAMKETKIRD